MSVKRIWGMRENQCVWGVVIVENTFNSEKGLVITELQSQKQLNFTDMLLLEQPPKQKLPLQS